MLTALHLLSFAALTTCLALSWLARGTAQAPIGHVSLILASLICLAAAVATLVRVVRL